MAVRTGRARLGVPTLTAADWTEAALQLIAERGVDGLTLAALGMRLGATKGSFYWHFASRKELLTAALRRWEERTTVDAVRALEAVNDPRRRVEMILDAAFQPPRARSLYSALAQAADNPIVGRALHRVASARIQYLKACYLGLGFEEARAEAMAALAYASYRGLLQLAREAPATLPQEWTAFRAAMRDAFVPAGGKSGRRSTG